RGRCVSAGGRGRRKPPGGRGSRPGGRTLALRAVLRGTTEGGGGEGGGRAGGEEGRAAPHCGGGGGPGGGGPRGGGRAGSRRRGRRRRRAAGTGPWKGWASTRRRSRSWRPRACRTAGAKASSASESNGTLSARGNGRKLPPCRVEARRGGALAAAPSGSRP